MTVGVEELPLLPVDEAIAADLTNPELYGSTEPERVWRALRRHGTPVWMGGSRPHWALTTFAQIRQFLQGAAPHASSASGNHLGDKSTDAAAAAAAEGLSLLVSDGERHRAMRAVLKSAFRPRLIRRLTDQTHSIARRLVAGAARAEELDFVAEVAVPFPAEVVCALLGVPAEDTAHVVELTSTAFGGVGSVTPADQMRAHAELFGYCDQLLTRKRAHPADDVASTLATARIDGAPIPRDVAIMNCHDLIAGGNETARHAVGASVLTMTGQQLYWNELRRGTADFRVAAEELLRLETPVSHILRVVRTDYELDGVRMRAGDLVTLWLRSANRDEAAFSSPHRLDPHRRPNQHLAFGHGPHYCIAAELGRMEIAAMLQALAELVGDVRVVGTPPLIRSNFFRGHEAIRVVLQPR